MKIKEVVSKRGHRGGSSEGQFLSRFQRKKDLKKTNVNMVIHDQYFKQTAVFRENKGNSTSKKRTLICSFTIVNCIILRKTGYFLRKTYFGGCF